MKKAVGENTDDLNQKKKANPFWIRLFMEMLDYFQRCGFIVG